MNNCEEYRQLISCFVDEVLSVQDASRLSEHLKQCPACTAYLRYLGDFAAVIPGGLMQDPPPELHTSVMEAIKRLPIPGSVPETAADVPDSDPSSGAARHLPPEGKAAAETPTKPAPARKKRAKIIPMMAGVAAAACIAVVLFVYPGVLRGAKNSSDATNGVTMYSPPSESSGTATGGAMASDQEDGFSKGADSGDAMDPRGSAITNNAMPQTAANSANGFGEASEDNMESANGYADASGGAAPSGEYAGGESSQDMNPADGSAASGAMGGSENSGQNGGSPYGGQVPGDTPEEPGATSSGSSEPGSETEEPTATGTDAPTTPPAVDAGPRTEDPDLFDAVLTWHGALDQTLKKLLASYLPEKGEDGVTRYYLPTKELLTLWDQTEAAYDIQVDPAVQAGDRSTGWSVVEVYPE